jgi:hypothetical protein
VGAALAPAKLRFALEFKKAAASPQAVAVTAATTVFRFLRRANFRTGKSVRMCGTGHSIKSLSVSPGARRSNVRTRSP